MDQLKVVLKHLKKHHFWLLSLIALITGLVGWIMATRALSASYLERKTKIVGKFSALQAVKDVEPHPNGQWKDGIAVLTGKERTTVRSAWQRVYDEQSKFLPWPEELGPDFLAHVKSLPPTGEIKPDLRERYRNYIKNEVPKLTEIIDAKPSERAAGSGPTPASSKPVDPNHEYRMVWSDANQQLLYKDLEWSQTPSDAQVRLAQEDLWIYRALLTIIQKANEGAKYSPRIKEITSLLIGKKAADASEAGMSGEHIVHLTGPAVATGEAPPAAAAQSGQEGPVAPDEGRYVGDDGKKLPAETAKKDQFRRTPVYLKVIIDQRDIARLLVECANAPLPLEVKQLRMLAKASSSSGGTGRPGQSSGGEAEAFDVPLELHGVIYIFNPPDLTALGGDQAAPGQAAPADAGAAPAAAGGPGG